MFDAGYQLASYGMSTLLRTGWSTGTTVFLGTQLMYGDIAYLAYLAMIIAMSYFTYLWIEKPGREWVRNRWGDDGNKPWLAQHR